MPTHNETQQLAYTTNQIFDLVADVEKYAEFLPWCVGARVLERVEEEGYFTAELLIGYKSLREKYTSKVMLTPPSEPHGDCSIHVELIKGPFHHLTNKWQLSPSEQNTEIHFELDFQFRTKILDKLLGGFFFKATEKMVDAFKDRADVLYG